MWRAHHEGPAPYPDPELDIFGLPVRYVPNGDAGAVDSDDDLPAVVVAFLRDNGGVPAETAEPFSLDALGLDHFRGKIRAAEFERWRAWLLLLGGIAFLALAWRAAGRAWRGHRAGRVGRAITTVFSVLTGLTVLLGLVGTGVTCYLRGRFSTRYLSKEERLSILDRAVAEGDVRANVAERARAYIRELP